MSAALIKLALLTKLLWPGGELVCQPTQPVWCTYFVSETLAFDLIEDPWGNVARYEWNPAEYIIK